MLTYYKFSVPASGAVVTVGTWATTEADARQHVSELEGCPETVLDLVTETEVKTQGELL